MTRSNLYRILVNRDQRSPRTIVTFMRIHRKNPIRLPLRLVTGLINLRRM